VPEIRRIRSGERTRVLDTVVAAFRRDPQLRWWFPAEDEYDEGARAFFGVLLDTRIEGGEVWVADGGRAVAMWVPPGGNLIGPELAETRYTATVASLDPAAAARIQRTDEAVDALLPTGAHWYLGVLACHPDHHGEGLGTLVAAPVLAAADRAALPVALETSSHVNVGFYTRRGFGVLGEVTLQDGPAGSATEPALELVGPGAPATGASPAADGAAGSARGSATGPVVTGGLSAGITVYVMQRQPRV
jgi:GNAT superfamily N-acetyltransferase